MQLKDVDLINPENFIAGVPHEAFAVLRKEAPVHGHAYPGDTGFGAITKYEDIVAVSKDNITFSSFRGGTLIKDLPEEDLNNTRTIMLNMDPPQHSKYRKLVS